MYNFIYNNNSTEYKKDFVVDNALTAGALISKGYTLKGTAPNNRPYGHVYESRVFFFINSPEIAREYRLIIGALDNVAHKIYRQDEISR